MRSIVLPALVALTLATGISGATARTVQDREFTDTTSKTGGYRANSPDGVRAFWDYQNRWGSGD